MLRYCALGDVRIVLDIVVTFTSWILMYVDDFMDMELLLFTYLHTMY